jgi:hypothetical protein
MERDLQSGLLLRVNAASVTTVAQPTQTRRLRLVVVSSVLAVYQFSYLAYVSERRAIAAYVRPRRIRSFRY